MLIKHWVLASAMALSSTGAFAACAYQNTVPIKSISAGFEAWKAVTSAMSECGNFEAELDQEFRTKQPTAFAAKPALYQIGGVSNGTIVPLLADGTIRPLDDLVEKYGKHLRNNQLIRIDGKIMAVAMMVNTQHLMYRHDILEKLGIPEPTTYEEVLAAAEKIQAAELVDYPLGGTYKPGWNLGTEFVNMYLGMGGEFFNGSQPSINNAQGEATLSMMKRLSAFMDPEYLTHDSTSVQQQFQQGKIAMANFWASRGAALSNEAESDVVGLITMSTAPKGTTRPASTLWWDGIVIAKNISDEQAEAAFRLAMEGMDKAMVQANPDAAIWLIEGYEPGPNAKGAADTAQAGALSYPSTQTMGLLHTALGNGVTAYLSGDKTAKATLADIEANYIQTAKEAGLL